MVKSIMITFESIYTRKVGGLAEVPPRLARELEEIGVKSEVFLPNHGFIDACSDSEFAFHHGGVVYCVKRLPEVKPLHYVVGGGVLDDPVVYSATTLLTKSLVFARILREYFTERIRGSHEDLVFHGHDWHSIPALLALNALTVEKGLRAGFILHFHLATKNRIELRDLCNTVLLCEHTPIRGDLGVLELKYYYELSGGIIERLGGLTVDKIIGVSRGFARVIPRYTGLNTESKIDYVYNASSITPSEVEETLVKHGVKNPWSLSERTRFREVLLTSGIQNIRVGFLDEETRRVVERYLVDYNVSYNEPFRSDGPLVFSIGRLARQKGFDYVLKALDKLTLEEPRIKIVLAAIPLSSSSPELRESIEAMLLYPDNLRVFPGVLPKEYSILFYYASNATLIPSRSEPFGLVAVESLASGTPVAASRVGGLQDIVIDVRQDPERGVGVLFKPGDIDEMVRATIELISIVEYTRGRGEEPSRIRENCVKRSLEFNWRNSAEKTKKIYLGVLGRA